MIIQQEQATVYRAGGRRWFTRKAALKAYANAKFRKKHPCECEAGDYASGYPGYTCGVHDWREKVVPRYLRLLKRREQSVPSADRLPRAEDGTPIHPTPDQDPR